MGNGIRVKGRDEICGLLIAQGGDLRPAFPLVNEVSVPDDAVVVVRFERRVASIVDHVYFIWDVAARDESIQACA
jgi:hypothetical protein